ncbi:MAG TPA: S53 family peptidase [Thermoleophilaceae bacterium]
MRISAVSAALACSLLLVLASAASARPSYPRGHHRDVCGLVGSGSARCHAEIVTDAAGNAVTNVTPAGYFPSDLRSAYAIPASSGAPGTGPTIAIVDAYDDPSAESDLGTYRSQFGLGACTTANGCFRKVSQSGTTRYPRSNGGWAQEISLDLDMASALCSSCKIMLVEASSNSFGNLLAAEDYATSHAAVVSNSWGGGEFSSETASTYDGHFNRPGVPITVSSGDAGYGVEFPAASRYVTAVGGTHLTRATSTRGWAETAWSGAGSGCSAYEAKPSWQTDKGCSKRTVADVSAVADPNTGVAVYDSYSYQGASGWLVFGGTSVAAPIVASVYADAGNAGATLYGSYPYSHGGSLNDVTAGSNGSCGGSYLCTSGSGFDGPTGLGTPNGLGAF